MRIVRHDCIRTGYPFVDKLMSGHWLTLAHEGDDIFRVTDFVIMPEQEHLKVHWFHGLRSAEIYYFSRRDALIGSYRAFPQGL